MKVNKIICDVCDKEIDVNVDAGLAMFEHIEVRQKIVFSQSPFNNRGREDMKSDKEVVKTSFDLCKSCASETQDFLLKKKEENINKNKGREDSNKDNKNKQNEKSQ